MESRFNHHAIIVLVQSTDFPSTWFTLIALDQADQLIVSCRSDLLMVLINAGLGTIRYVYVEVDSIDWQPGLKLEPCRSAFDFIAEHVDQHVGFHGQAND